MARQERNDVDYFPHPVNHGKGMHYIRSKYKNDGYVVWFMILEKLGRAEKHFLDLKNEIEIMYLSSELKVTEELLKDILNDLVRLGDFDKQLWEEESILWNEKFVNSIKDAYRKRRNECVDRTSLLRSLEKDGRLISPKFRPKELSGRLKGGRNTQSKVKDSKEEESKVKTSSKKEEAITKFLNWFNRRKKELHYKNKTGRPFKMLSETAYRNLKKLQKAYDPKEFDIAIRNLFKNNWAIESGNLTPDHFLVTKNFERYLSKEDNKKQGVHSTLQQTKIEQ